MTIVVTSIPITDRLSANNEEIDFAGKNTPAKKPGLRFCMKALLEFLSVSVHACASISE